MKIQSNSLDDIIERINKKVGVCDVKKIWENDIQKDGYSIYLLFVLYEKGTRKYIKVTQDKEFKNNYDIESYEAETITQIVEYETYGKVVTNA